MRRRALRLRDRLRGYGITVERWPLPDSLEANLKRVLRAQHINGVLDVGANRGQYYRLIRSLGYDGEIICFEPATVAHEWLLRTTAEDPDAFTVKCALGAQPETATLRLYQGTSLNSLLDANAQGHAEFAEMSLVGYEDVEVQRLDAVLPSLIAHVPEPSLLLKCDTQGYDLQVLRGAQGVLGEVRAVQVELAAQPLYDSVDLMHDVVAWLWEREFTLVGMSTVNRDRRGFKTLEVDAVFSR